MILKSPVVIYLVIFLILVVHVVSNVFIHGPGLQPENVMPARYFFIDITEKEYTPDLGNKVAVEIKGKLRNNKDCRIWINKLDRKDGTIIIRYKIYETCYNVSIKVYFDSKDVTGSPLKFKGPIHPEQCNCPKQNFELWLQDYGCPTSYNQINSDLKPFKTVDINKQIKKIIERYHKPESVSFCHYIVKDNQVFRECYGKHVGFNMFADNILLFLSRKVKMPDMELVINLGDWPLIHKNSELLPVFSWCGSDETMDIVMPTYDITESTLENMGRVTLDMLSVQSSVEHEWSRREPRAIWRGRDSRAERLRLIDIGRENPDLFNVSLTNFFFFRDKEKEYGPKQPHISFFKFFDYKYQINIDGTVAAYRMPYLLGGGGVVLKQDSPFYEHFYKQLLPWVHYIPINRDLSNLKERVIWAREHDSEVQKIAKNARQFANDNLLPREIICYHAVLFSEWSKRIKSEIKIPEGMTAVPQPQFPCKCDYEKPTHTDHEEL